MILSCCRNSTYSPEQTTSTVSFVRDIGFLPDKNIYSQLLSGQLAFLRTKCSFGSSCPEMWLSTGQTASPTLHSSKNDFHRTTSPLQIFQCHRKRFSPFRYQREKRINLVPGQTKYPADLAVGGTKFISKFTGKVEFLRLCQVLDGGDTIIRPQ